MLYYHPQGSAIYVDSFFTSITLVEYLRDTYKCRYTGTARKNRTGRPGLTNTKEVIHSKTPRGAMYFRSTESILALRWKDKKIVTLLSTDMGVEPVSTVKRYDKTAKEKMSCPQVIKQYNSHMGGTDKSDMLT